MVTVQNDTSDYFPLEVLDFPLEVLVRHQERTRVYSQSARGRPDAQGNDLRATRFFIQ